jgi:hypothetical protein
MRDIPASESPHWRNDTAISEVEHFIATPFAVDYADSGITFAVASAVLSGVRPICGHAGNEIRSGSN